MSLNEWKQLQAQFPAVRNRFIHSLCVGPPPIGASSTGAMGGGKAGGDELGPGGTAAGTTTGVGGKVGESEHAGSGGGGNGGGGGGGGGKSDFEDDGLGDESAHVRLEALTKMAVAKGGSLAAVVVFELFEAGFVREETRHSWFKRCLHHICTNEWVDNNDRMNESMENRWMG